MNRNDGPMRSTIVASPLIFDPLGYRMIDMIILRQRGGACLGLWISRNSQSLAHIVGTIVPPAREARLCQ